MRILRIVPGVALIVSVGLVALTTWDALVANNPAYPITLVVAGVLGLLLLITGMTTTGEPGGGALRTTLRAAASAAGVGLAAVLFWYQPFPATEAALAALDSGEGVTVSEDRSRITFVPDDPSGAGLVVYPGARVDPRAYAVLARSIAAEGHEVVVLKCAFDTALLCTGSASDYVTDDAAWAVGGHSLGGVAASSFVGEPDNAAMGLVLWASWPLNDLSGADLPAVSIYGSEDGLATPEEVLAARPDLPETAAFVAVEGAVHAFFGDYGAQPGDGEPTVPRETAQGEIVQATAALLDALAE